MIANVTNTSPLLAAGSLGAIVFLVVVAVVVLVNWLRKKKDDDQWRQSTHNAPPSRAGQPRASAPPVSKAANWEEELRRMLEMDQPGSMPAPPIVRQKQPAPPPLPKAAAAPAPPPPPIFGPTKTYKAHCDSCGTHIEFASAMMGESIICPHCYQQTTLQPFMQTRVEEITHKPHLASFQDSAGAHQRASHIDEDVATRFQDLTTKHVPATTISARRLRSAETLQVISLLRTPQTARQVILASVILSPPKALEG
jgi:hypothetical protein